MTSTPRFQVLAHTDRGDMPRYTNDPDMVPELLFEARRSPHVGSITVEDRCNGIVVTGGSEGWDDLDTFVLLLDRTPCAA